MTRWQLSSPLPVPGRVWDGLRVKEITLRFPDGAPAGGEITLELLYQGQVVATERGALEPGEPDAITDLGRWTARVLARLGRLPAGATEQPTGGPGVH